MRSTTIVFDVNETLLDLRGLTAAFEAEVGTVDLLPAWFSRLVRDALVATLTDSYRPFDVLAMDALVAVARSAAIDLDPSAAETVVDGMGRLPAHDDVRSSLEQLRSAGFRTAALTNSPPHLLERQLTNAGIDDLFDASLSVDAVRRFKPHPEVYRSGAERLGIPITSMRLVAAHDWDVTGAIRAGALGAYVARRAPLVAPYEIPDIIGPDLHAVAGAIVATDR